jgi:AraC-like DNA-binding protein
MEGFSRVFRPSPALAGIVEAIWNWEIPDNEAARGAISIALPCPYPILSVHYGEPIWSNRQHGSGYYRQIATGIQTGVVTFRPSGPSGCVVVRLKPEAAARVTGSTISDFADTNVALDDVFGPGEMAWLRERLIEARSSLKRIACVEAFLLRHLRHDRPNAIASYAASYLRGDPALPVHKLAERLEVSRRHLSRSFLSTFGVTPKQFARVVRIGKLLAARRHHGLSWADAAVKCGFTDQAHMINDFSALTGVSPQEFFRAPSVEPRRGFNSSLVESHFYNQFFSS